MKATFLNRAVFIGAFLEDNLIGFIKLVANEDGSQAGLMHIISMIQHRDKAPTNALMAQAVRSCAERGIAYLWYANFSYGKKQGDSLGGIQATQRISESRRTKILRTSNGYGTGWRFAWAFTMTLRIGSLSRWPPDTARSVASGMQNGFQSA